MRRLYLVIPGQDLSRRVVDAMRDDGLDPHALRLFAPRPRQFEGLPVDVAGLGSSTRHLLAYALWGGTAALVVALSLLAVGAAPALLPVLVVLGAAAGALVARWRRLPAAVERLRPELQPDDVVMLVDVADEDLAKIEKRIKARHPEIRVKGTDPAGSPPFP